MANAATSSAVGSPPELRRVLLALALDFVREVRLLPGVERLALLGSILTEKTRPKDIDILVTIGETCELRLLAARARRLKGRAQSHGAGADVFLAAANGVYLGRTCLWRTCRPGVRISCDASHCGRRPFLHDDLRTITLTQAMIREPPLEVFPHSVARCALPADVADWLGEVGALAT